MSNFPKCKLILAEEAYLGVYSVLGIEARAHCHGICLYSSSNNTIKGNNVTNNREGIWLEDSSSNTICRNKMTNRQHGIVLLYSSNYNSLSGNNVRAREPHHNGIYLGESSNNIIFGNNVTNEWRGIVLYYSSSNIIYHNNFADNREQAFSYTPLITNVWDGGYPSGGNYWSDYTGVDLYSGPYQNETGMDRIGDTPYIIGGKNIDHYPFQDPNGWLLPPPILGDINDDGIVSMNDVVIAALAFGSYPGHPNWNPDADPNIDDTINIIDLVIIGVNFGKRLPL